MKRILKKLLPLFFAGGALLSSGAHAVTCETFAAGDTDYVAKLNLLVAGCSPTSNLVSSLPRAAAGGTVDAITATFSPAITLADQTIVAVVAAGANATTTPTFAPNGLTAHTIVARGGGALVAGDIAGAGFVALLEYNLANTRWELLNPSASSASGTVTNISGNLDSPKLVIANNGSDVTTSAGITSDGTSQIELGVAGSAVGSVKFRNATSGSITLQPTTGALGTRTITMPATTGTMALTSDIVAPTLTSTYVGYGSGSNLLTGTSDLTYATATGTLTMTQAVNAAMRINVWNTSAGTGAFSALTATNDNNNVAQLIKYGTGWTTVGLLTAGWASLYNNSTGMLYANTAAEDHVWSRGGTAATNEVARLGAGSLSLGVAGTTVGSVVFNNATSGTITLSPPTGALSGTLTVPSGGGTLAVTASPTFTGTVGAADIAATGTITIGTNPASTGIIRIPYNQSIYSRNSTNGANLFVIGAGAGNAIYIGGSGNGVDFNGDDIFDVNSFGVIRGITSGQNGVAGGSLKLNGATTGQANLTVAAAAGSPTLTLPTVTGTLATLAGTETLTNKSIAGSQLTGAYTSSGMTMATAKVLGRATAGTGAVEELATTGTGNVALSASPTFTGTVGAAAITATGTIADAIGDVRILPQNSKSAAYTTVLADCGKHILHPSADTTARIFTIDSNANVAAPIGCMITFVNQNAGGVITIAITSDTMRLAGAGTTGSRTLAANCVATALKIVATEWIISGGSCLT